MDVFMYIAEQKIQEAMNNGEFDNLRNKGKPLQLDNLSHVPPELRAAYKILKNANILPEELQLKKDMITLQELINCCYDKEERKTLRKKLNEKTLRFNMIMEKRNVKNFVLNQYMEKIDKKLGL